MHRLLGVTRVDHSHDGGLIGCNCGSCVLQETLEDIDKDKDGSISLQEYIGKSGQLSLAVAFLLQHRMLVCISTLC